MKSKRIRNRNSILPLFLLVSFMVLFLSVGYSTFSKNILIDDFVSVVRPDLNVRITGFAVDSTSNNGNAIDADYTVSSVFSNLTLPNSNSSITYTVSVKNYGNVEMGIKSISLPSELENILEVTIDGYTVGAKLRDNSDACENSADGCKLSIDRTFNITVKYRNGAYNSNNINFSNFRLDFEFVEAFKVIYTGFTVINPSADMNANSVLDGNTYSYNIGEYESLIVKMGGLTINDYTIDSNNNLVVPNVTGNLEIIINEIMIPVKIDVKYPANIATIKYSINGGAEQSATGSLNISVPKGSRLKVDVTATSNDVIYEPYSETFNNIVSDINKEISLSSYCNVKISANPTTATIKYSIDGGAEQSVTGTLSGKYSPGTKIKVTVSDSGYSSVVKEYTVNSHIDETITLQRVYSIKLTTVPNDAEIKYTINGGAEQTAIGSFSGSFAAGTVINITISKSGYGTYSARYILNSDYNSTITLVQIFTYTVNSNVSSTISINDSNGTTLKECTSATTCSLIVPSGTPIVSVISADYYQTVVIPDSNVTSDITENVSLKLNDDKTITVNSNSSSCSNCMGSGDGSNGRDDSELTYASTNMLTNDCTMNYVFSNFGSIPDDALIQSVVAEYIIDGSVSPTVTQTLSIGSTPCASDSFTYSATGSRTYTLTCAPSVSELKSSGMNLNFYWAKKSGLSALTAYGRVYNVKLIINYIPKKQS